MGWMCVHKEDGVSVKEFLMRIFHKEWTDEEGSAGTLICSVRSNVAYLAIERIRPDYTTTIFGMVCLITYHKNEYQNFCYKDMSEDMNPFYYDCPQKILDILSPTDNENAQEWRRLCRERKKSLSFKEGDILEFEEEILFGEGGSIKVKRLTCTNKRQLQFSSEDYPETIFGMKKSTLESKPFRIISKEGEDKKKKLLNELKNLEELRF